MCVNYEPWNPSVASYASSLPSKCGTIDFYPSMYLLYLSYVQVLIIPLSTPSNFHFERLKVSASIITLTSVIASSMRQPGPFYGLCKSKPTREREKYFSNSSRKKLQTLCPPQDISFCPLYSYKYSIFL